MKNIRVFFLSENFQFLEMKFSIYSNRRVFVMKALLQPTNFTLGPDATQAIGFSAQDKEFKSNMRRPSWISDQNDFSLLIRTLLVCK